MHIHRVLTLTAFGLGLSAPGLLNPDASNAVAHAQDARQREMYVSVLNESGAPVTDLKADEFIVREDGVRREVLRAEKATDPIDLAIIVDNSRAAVSAIRDIRVALEAFVREMAAKNSLALVTIGERPVLVVNYIQETAPLEKGVERIFSIPDSGAYLLEGLIEVVKGLRTREAPRKAIVAITTEGPEFSNRYYEAVLQPLRESGAALHVLVLVGLGGGDMTSDEARNRNLVISLGTQATGGRWENLLSSMSLETNLKQLAAELASQYRLVYARPESLIPPTKVEVAVTRPDLVARGTPVRTRPPA